jgi:hypothetical protein
MQILQVSNPPPRIGCSRKLPPKRHLPIHSTAKVKASSSTAVAENCDATQLVESANNFKQTAVLEANGSSLVEVTAVESLQHVELTNNCKETCVLQKNSALLVETAAVETDFRRPSSSQPKSTSGLMGRTCKESPTKLLLRRKIRMLQSQRWKLTRRVSALSAALDQKTALKDNKHRQCLTDEHARASFEAVAGVLTPLQGEFFRSQILGKKCKRKGVRWSVKLKLFCLQLHFKSPAAYKFLMHSFMMPSVSTLYRFVNDTVGRMQPGFNENMFRVVGLRAKSLAHHDRQCALIFYEVSLKCQLVYDKNIDRIIGYTDDGKLATHALVFMVRGLHDKWKQAAAFFFTHCTVSADLLSTLVPVCVEKLRDVGLYVRCVVCDQGPTNIAALRKLGFSESTPKITLPTVSPPIYVIFDVPHLIKNVRNNLQRHNVKFGDDVACWTDINRFYDIDKAQAIRSAPRLTDGHINVSHAKKMRVRLAAQILSHSVAAGINMQVSTKQLPVAALGTATFVENMDAVFDLLNSRQLVGDRPSRCAITSHNNNLNRLMELKSWVSKWHFEGVRSQSSIKCHMGLQTSISSIVSLSQELLSEGFKFVCTSRFNQDCLENFFASIRSKHGWHENPNAVQFMSAYRNAIVLSSLDAQSSGKNCIDDDDFVLINHSDIVSDATSIDLHDSIPAFNQPCLRLSHCRDVSSQQDTVVPHSEVLVEHNYSSFETCVKNQQLNAVHSTVELEPQSADENEPVEIPCIPLTPHNIASTSADKTSWSVVDNSVLNCDIEFESDVVELFTEIEETLTSYLCGWVARKAGICKTCQQVLTKPDAEHSYVCRGQDLFASKKRFLDSSSVGLVSPSEELFGVVRLIEQGFRLKFEDAMLKPETVMNLFRQIYPDCDFSFLFIRHPQHALYLSEKVTKLYLTMRLYYAVKFYNRDLKSNTKTDELQSARRSVTKRKMQKILHQ